MDTGQNEEDDYMSDAFLASVAQVTGSAPGLLPKRSSEYRKICVEKKTRGANATNRTKSVKEREREAREEKLSKPIEESNKGYALLTKMGYKPGDKLGKSSSGLAEPIGITVREGTLGLGMEAKRRKDKEQEMQELMAKRARLEKEEIPDYRVRMRNERQRKQMVKDLLGSQRICAELDTRAGIESHRLWISEQEDDDVQEVEAQLEEDDLAQEQHLLLQEVTRYLRREHLYCYWCGSAFGDEETMMNACPGDTREAHE